MGFRSSEDDEFPVSTPVGDLPGEVDDVEKYEELASRLDGERSPSAVADRPDVATGDNKNEATEGIEVDDDSWDLSELEREDPLAVIDDDDGDD